jgi:hypothetical protein
MKTAATSSAVTSRSTYPSTGFSASSTTFASPAAPNVTTLSRIGRFGSAASFSFAARPAALSEFSSDSFRPSVKIRT